MVSVYNSYYISAHLYCDHFAQQFTMRYPDELFTGLHIPLNVEDLGTGD